MPVPALPFPRLIVFASFFALSCIAVATESEPGPGPDSSNTLHPVSYQRDIEPIFRRQCFGCHQGAKQLGNYMMTDFASLVAGGESGEAAIVAGDASASYLIDQITQTDGRAEMPKAPSKPLSAVEVELITRWVNQGAKNDMPVSSGPKWSTENPPEYVGTPPIPSIDVSPDGSTIAVAGLHEVILLDGASGKLQSRLIGLSPRINTVRFSPDGSRLVAVGGTPALQGEVQIWNVAKTELEISLPFTYDALCGAAWSPDGSKIAFGASDNIVRAIDASTGERVLFQGAHEDWVRDVVFTPDGKHLVSVARDMSCKLTEVETERFVDNITSITPGALSGGMNSVAVHPDRNEIVVGGADGIAKVYRVYRQTTRRIGDDANLIRNLPKMPGRIFSVVVSQDGSRIAASSTLDGKSQVRVWKYDFDGELSAKMKAILGKRVSDRNADDKKLVESERNKAVTELASWTTENAAIYSVAFASDNSLLISADDANLHRLSADGDLVATYPVVKLSKPSKVTSSSFDAKHWMEIQTQRLETNLEEKIPNLDEATNLRILPASVTLDSPYGYTQLVVMATMSDGSEVDVTRVCKIDSPDFVTISASGMIRPLLDGDSQILVRLGKITRKVDVSVSCFNSAPALELGSVDYIRDVNPVLSRLGCNQGTCHGAQKGKNGFKLSLRGYDPIFDLRALTDDHASRRINPASPDDSLMLRKPLGLIPHEGGVLMDEGDPNYTILRRWIADGSHLDLGTPRVTSIEVTPENPTALLIGSRQQVRVVAMFEDGSRRDVTAEAFIESGNTEVASADRAGLLVSVRRGEAPILARYEGAYAATTLTVMGDRSGYQEQDVETWSKIDELVAEKWKRVKVLPSPLCDDSTYLRRIYLDLTGLLPDAETVRKFLADKTPTRQKRAKVVDSLIGSEPYVEYWTNKWASLLQVNRKFLGVEGSKKFHDWIRDAVAKNKPYDKFASEVLTATGSNNENPPASYFKVLRQPDDIMENTTHLFLGVRFNCNKCHDHPFERWTQDQYYQMSAFFAHVGLQADPASKGKKIGGTAVEGATPLFEKVIDRPSGEVKHARTGEVVQPEFPYQVDCEHNDSKTRREKLAVWMTDPDNPYFARSYVNRIWSHLFGIGLIEPVDDIRAGNPATNPELLDHLTALFIKSEFNTQALLRAICFSRTYQLSVKTNALNHDDKLNYSHALPRRLPAEVIYDAVHQVTGAISKIPGVPAGTRAAALSDSGIKLSDGFLQNLGRPARESACECERSSDLQLGPVMALISGPTIGTAISDPKNELKQIVQRSEVDAALAEEIFLRALSRLPTEDELEAFRTVAGEIRVDHKILVAALKQAEQDWKTRRAELETMRKQKLAKTKKEISKRVEEIKPDRERLAEQREANIAKAEADLKTARDALPQKVNEWAKKHSPSVTWYPLAPTNLRSTNKAKLVAQQDRSIIATGEKKQGVYTAQFDTKLDKITGFRVEVIASPDLPSNGPGLAANGNFALSELIVKASTKDETGKLGSANQLLIESGTADFTQDGFNIKQTFDGQTRGNRGWAVSGATGVTHWATFKLASPLDNAHGCRLTFDLHQFHKAADHRVGRFRISVTTDNGDIPLDLPESFAAVVNTPIANRDESMLKKLSDYVAATDKSIVVSKTKLATARKPLPADKLLSVLQQREKELTKETADDSSLIQLRKDVAESAKQVANLRLTAAEDLAWALINSPAFLFNH